MNKRMLIDGTHPEEVRVVIADGNKLEEYDIESSTKTQLKGNIYLAKVMRVEPSLQAAFVDFGGNRHGFLAFSEIHPDYYQIPVEDREALKRDVALFEENAIAAHAHIDSIDGDLTDVEDDDDEQDETDAHDDRTSDSDDEDHGSSDDHDDGSESEADVSAAEDTAGPEDETRSAGADDAPPADEGSTDGDEPGAESKTGKASRGRRTDRRENPMRRYKIQEVIKRRQILLVQVVKEERGNKGAALTSYLSLAGRYCVLMPNTSRSGGGVSRKITSTTDRRRLRDLLKSLEVPEGMGVIMRTAGMERNKSEIKRDFDYLMRLWEEIRELTLNSAAPALVYEEGDLIKRTIRDLYSREIEEVLVEGNEAYQAAKKVMRLMMPSHAKRVQPYRDETMPLFHRFQVESLLEAMHSPIVQLKSGGYIVIDQTEALVAIDVNSGRSTKERNIEETAVKTNLEAASEVALQLRLRDLAGLIVIDFIDMDESRNQRAVEKRFKEAVKNDRARMQLGRISSFGLLELSRQRMRPSLMETSSDVCTHCGGTGHVRSIESMAVRVLRMIEEESTHERSSEITVTVPTAVALYVLNQKRATLTAIEARCGFSVHILGDDTVSMNDAKLERVKSRPSGSSKVATEAPAAVVIDAETDAESDNNDADEQEEKNPARKRRPRRRRRKESTGEEAETGAVVKTSTGTVGDASSETAQDAGAPTDVADERQDSAPQGDDDDETKPKRRRRGRRGGRRRSQKSAQDDSEVPEAAAGDMPAGDEATVPAAAESDASRSEEPVEKPVEERAPEQAPVESTAEATIVDATTSEAVTAGLKSDETKKVGNGEAVAESATGENVAPVPADSTVQPTAEGNPAPQRRGWWQRMME